MEKSKLLENSNSRIKLNNWVRYTPLLFLLPVAIELIIFRYIPSFSAIYYSFTDWDVMGDWKMVGLENYRELFDDRVFKSTLWNMLTYTSIRTVATLTMAFIAAALVLSVRDPVIRMYWKIAFVMPMVMPRSLLYILWGFIYEPQAGMLNEGLIAIGLEGLTQPWLGQSSTALAAISIIGFPFVSTLAFLVFITSLEGISRDLIETSELEGGSVLKRIFVVDLPMLRAPIIFIALLVALESMQAVEPQLILTRGGPGSATEMPGHYLYTVAFSYFNFGLACAIGVIILLIGLILSGISTWMRYRGAYDVD